MKGYKNEITLVGNLGADAEIIPFKNGGRIAVLSLAESESWKDRNGEWQSKTNWHRVTVRSPGLIKMLEKSGKKGQRVMVHGQMVKRTYNDKNGVKKTSHEVIVPPYTGDIDILQKGPGRINRATLMGNLGADAQVKTFQNGSSLISFSIATETSYKNAAGEWVNQTEWHNVSLRDNRLIALADKLTKGSKVWIEGRLEHNTWTDANGNKRVSAEIVVRANGSIQIMSSPTTAKSENSGSSEDPYEYPIPNDSEYNLVNPEDEDDLPF